jgi:hypothetical protein
MCARYPRYQKIPKFQLAFSWACIKQHEGRISQSFMTLNVSSGPLFKYFGLKVGEARFFKLLASPKRVNKINSIKLKLFVQTSVRVDMVVRIYMMN